MCGLGRALFSRIACLLIVIATILTVSQPIRQSVSAASSDVISNTYLDSFIKAIANWGNQDEAIEKENAREKQKKRKEKCGENCNSFTVETKQEKPDDEKNPVNQTYIILFLAFIVSLFALFRPNDVLMFFLFIYSTVFVLFILSTTYNSIRSEQAIALILIPASLFLLDFYARICYLIFAYVSPLYNNNNFDHLGGKGAFFNLLPSQESVVKLIKDYAGFIDTPSAPSATPPDDNKRFSPATGAVLISVEGAWGSGKTVCVDAFERWARKEGGAVVVNVKAGQLEAEEHIESALMRTIIRNWDVASNGGWLAVPALGIVFSQGRDILKFAIWLGRSLVSSTAQSQEAQAHDTSAHKVLWYNTLRAIVCRITRERGFFSTKRKVFCLIVDDIDRCSPLVAQRIMTLLRRFFDIPGLIIVTPFVKEQLYYKAFDPDQELLADFAATAEAYLEDRYRDEAAYVDEVKKAIADHWDRRIKPLVLPPPAQGSGASPDKQGAAPSTLRELDREARDIRQAIRHRKYRSMSPDQRDEIAQSLASKYVSDHIIIVRPPSVDDMHRVIMQMLDYKKWVARLAEILEHKVDARASKEFEERVFSRDFIDRAIGKDIADHRRKYGINSNSNIWYLRDTREQISRTLQSTIIDVNDDKIGRVDDAYFLLMTVLKLARIRNVAVAT